MARWLACCCIWTCAPARNAWTSTPSTPTCRRRPPDPTALASPYRCRRDCGDLDGEEPEMSDHRRHPAPSSWLLVLRLSIASVGAAGGETGVSPIATTRTPLST